jgi:hypothetical protein
MAVQCQGQVVLFHAAPIIAHAEEFNAAFFKFDIDAGSTGVKTVFQQFLDHGGGALSHFTGGKLVALALAE